MTAVFEPGKVAPQVSVIVPVYNCGLYLDGAIASILGQTLNDLELIAVNDGSTDDSGVRLDAIAQTDPRLRVFHVSNGGIVAALNYGLEHARGKYIARMDGDDLAYPERLEKQYAFLEQHPDHAFVGSLFRVIDGEGRPGHVQRPTTQTRQTSFASFPPYVASVPHPTLMARRTVLTAVGGYRSQFPHAEDHDLFIRMARYGKVRVLPEVLLDYRIHAGAVSTKHSSTQLDSALMAQAAGEAMHSTGAEPLGMTLEHLGAEWQALRHLRQIEHLLDRRDAFAAMGALVKSLPSAVRAVPALARRRAVFSFTRTIARSALRSAAIAVRG